MSDQASSAAQTSSAPDTFCTYLARQFIAKKSFTVGAVPEAAELGAHCDILLSHFDGFGFTIICMVDREAHPGKTFSLPAAAIQTIGEACLKYSGEINRKKIPIHIQIMEVGPATGDARQRLAQYKPGSLYGKVLTSAWTVDPAKGSLWTNARFGGFFAGTRFIRRLLQTPREANLNLDAPVIAASPNPQRFEWLTYAIIAALCGVFAAEVIYGIGSWTGPLQPTIATLTAFGGLARKLVMQSGEWHRLFSAPLLHADVFHLALNCIAIWLAGRGLENLVGRAWFGAMFVIGAIGGSLLSLALNADNILSVGASGAVTALFAALLILSHHFPRGPDRSGLIVVAAYMLVPSLLPLASIFKGQSVDYAAHFGGALAGAALGLLLLTIWPANRPHPNFRSVAALFALAGAALFAYSLAPVAGKIF